ncbi:MAG TPA: GWxTD domain-containing protein [Cyclobacteriaceae bacterium]
MKAVRFFFSILCIGISSVVSAQNLRDINYSYLYNGSTGFSFDLAPIRQTDGWTVFFRLQLSDTTYSINAYTIQWDKREQLTDKEGSTISSDQITLASAKLSQTGNLKFGLSTNQQIIVAKVINNTTKRAWIFYTVLFPDHSVNSYLQSADGDFIFEPYINVNKSVALHGFKEDESVIVSYYNDAFPAAAPAFSEGLARVNAAIKPDSIFTLTNAQLTSFSKKGLYLVQKDTTTVEGFAFRVEDGYPKFKHIQDLVGPFVYVCAKDEYDKLRMAGNDKKQFDKNVLAITRDTDRAREFMKTYFNRAEVANHLFTSYKEGWKTDRGMTYLIYGPPPTVYKFADREVWSYGRTDFSFAKSSTLFDPDNYVLIRNKKYATEWYEKVDLIRNSRF